MTLIETINNAHARLAAVSIPDARRDAELLLCHSLGRNRAWLITHFQVALDEGIRRIFEGAVQRRSEREPLQYIIGRQEFWGLDFTVTPEVLIPRPETELIIESALRIGGGKDASLTIADLCTGSGCLAISLAKEREQAQLFATDISATALVVAMENARNHEVSARIRFLEGDLFEPLGELDLRGRIDIIVSNPPYIPSGDLGALQPEVRDYEPGMALIAGPDGTEIQKRIINEAPEFMKKNGALILEMGLGQAAALAAFFKENGKYRAPEILNDLAGIERVIVARKA